MGVTAISCRSQSPIELAIEAATQPKHVTYPRYQMHLLRAQPRWPAIFDIGPFIRRIRLPLQEVVQGALVGKQRLRI